MAPHILVKFPNPLATGSWGTWQHMTHTPALLAHLQHCWMCCAVVPNVHWRKRDRLALDLFDNPTLWLPGDLTLWKMWCWSCDENLSFCKIFHLVMSIMCCTSWHCFRASPTCFAILSAWSFWSQSKKQPDCVGLLCHRWSWRWYRPAQLRTPWRFAGLWPAKSPTIPWTHHCPSALGLNHPG